MQYMLIPPTGLRPCKYFASPADPANLPLSHSMTEVFDNLIKILNTLDWSVVEKRQEKVMKKGYEMEKPDSCCSMS